MCLTLHARCQLAVAVGRPGHQRQRGVTLGWQQRRALEVHQLPDRVVAQGPIKVCMELLWWWVGEGGSEMKEEEEAHRKAKSKRKQQMLLLIIIVVLRRC